MLTRKPDGATQVATSYQVAVLVLLWLFILMWISPLATFARPLDAAVKESNPASLAAGTTATTLTR